jgi:hypothetical protein
MRLFKNMSAEAKLITAYLFGLFIIGLLLYFYPVQFFNIYDKIYYFLIS